jgi:putative ABC transport system ATP-binding protein
MAWWSRSKQHGSDINERERDPSLPLVRLSGVSKTFTGDADEETHALVDVTVDIDRGQYVSVSGPSGCGKSTLLSVLALLETPTAGRYWLNGRRTALLTPAERARARSVEIGLIFQSFNLIADMSVYENVEYPLTLRNASPKERAERANAALERVGMLARAKQRPGQLSGGHQQLVAIARAVAGQPPMLLADEPTGNLDSKAGDALMDLLSELHAGGATVVLATHNPLYIARAERHIYLFDGRVVPEPVADGV